MIRIGINGASLVATGAPLAGLIDHAVTAEDDGFASYWVPQMVLPDALTAIATMGSRTSRIELGTAVVPTWARHPLMLAAQALTVQEATGNRLTLGIGLAHQAIVEDTLKVPFKTPARHMDEYLSVLVPALTKRSVSFSGSIWSGDDDLAGAPDAVSPSLLVAAMGPRLLRLAGGRTDGTILWLSGPRTIASAIRPVLDAAAFEAGRPPPRIVAGLPVCVTNDPGRVRQRIARALSLYGELPSYRAVLDTEGVDGPADVALIGDEADIRAGLAALAEAGATDFAATEFGTNAGESIATRRLLVALADE